MLFPQAAPGPVTEPIDLALLTRLREVVEEATAAFVAFEPSRALERTETFFWSFCDDYIELVKTRAYGEGPAADSANRALRQTLEVLLRLFAPFLCFATEEIWSWWQDGSVHNAPWPTAAEITIDQPGDPELLVAAGEVLLAVRKAKSLAKVSMRAEVELVVVTNTTEFLTLVQLAQGDLINAGLVAQMIFSTGEPAVEVTLAPVEQTA